VSCYGQRSERAKIATVFEGYEAEWDDDEKDGFLVNVQTKEKGSVSAKCDCPDEGIPRWIEEELD
jgi:hypothetical protein